MPCGACSVPDVAQCAAAGQGELVIEQRHSQQSGHVEAHDNKQRTTNGAGQWSIVTNGIPDDPDRCPHRNKDDRETRDKGQRGEDSAPPRPRRRLRRGGHECANEDRNDRQEAGRSKRHHAGGQREGDSEAGHDGRRLRRMCRS